MLCMLQNTTRSNTTQAVGGSSTRGILPFRQPLSFLSAVSADHQPGSASGGLCGGSDDRTDAPKCAAAAVGQPDHGCPRCSGYAPSPICFCSCPAPPCDALAKPALPWQSNRPKETYHLKQCIKSCLPVYLPTSALALLVTHNCQHVHVICLDPSVSM